MERISENCRLYSAADSDPWPELSGIGVTHVATDLRFGGFKSLPRLSDQIVKHGLTDVRNIAAWIPQGIEVPAGGRLHVWCSRYEDGGFRLAWTSAHNHTNRKAQFKYKHVEGRRSIPVAMQRWLVSLLGIPDRNALLLDPYMADAQIGVACAQLGIPFVGMFGELPQRERSRLRDAWLFADADWEKLNAS